MTARIFHALFNSGGLSAGDLKVVCVSGEHTQSEFSRTLLQQSDLDTVERTDNGYVLTSLGLGRLTKWRSDHGMRTISHDDREALAGLLIEAEATDLPGLVSRFGFSPVMCMVQMRHALSGCSDPEDDR
ncbi:hypothetical protein HON52_04775 [Candidatus Uhrbacteria bacterium]|nr:hypothetical protein [Candidatus Uhrbacteria bacterium]